MRQRDGTRQSGRGVGLRPGGSRGRTRGRAAATQLVHQHIAALTHLRGRGSLPRQKVAECTSLLRRTASVASCGAAGGVTSATTSNSPLSQSTMVRRAGVSPRSGRVLSAGPFRAARPAALQPPRRAPPPRDFPFPPNPCFTQLAPSGYHRDVDAHKIDSVPEAAGVLSGLKGQVVSSLKRNHRFASRRTRAM